MIILLGMMSVYRYVGRVHVILLYIYMYIYMIVTEHQDLLVRGCPPHEHATAYCII
jgi:hypothetical protein